MGVFNHITHPCEVCNRIQAEGIVRLPVVDVGTKLNRFRRKL